MSDADDRDEDFEDDEELDDEFEDDDYDDEDDGADANTLPAANARAVLEYLARAVVDDPDAVEVDVEDGRGRTVQLAVHVADGDMGRVIGKRGRVANAIRTVVRAAAVRDDVEVDVEFVD
jgi:predicted RNA-binding protein YlqC (UPF0109 family)